MALQQASLKWVRELPCLACVDGFRFADPPREHLEHVRGVCEQLNSGDRVTARPGAPFYFLTHFHSDHYTGLTPFFSKGIVWTTEATARLVCSRLGLPSEQVRAVPLSRAGALRPVELCNGVEAILLDANHCPGAGMVVFRCRALKRVVLHCGDMRASSEAVEGWRAALEEWGVRTASDGATPGDVSVVYLDSTYLSPSVVASRTNFDFPSQNAVLAALGAFASRLPATTLFAVGTYQLGKERAAEAIAEACGGRVAVVQDEKQEIIQLSGLSDSGRYCTSVTASDRVVLIPLSDVREDVLGALLLDERVAKCGLERVVGLRLTGWNFPSLRAKHILWSPEKVLERVVLGATSGEDAVRIVNLPYSEHSSLSELRLFCRDIAPQRVTFTVNAETAAMRRRMMERLRVSLPWLPASKGTLLTAMTERTASSPMTTMTTPHGLATTPAASCGEPGKDDDDSDCQIIEEEPARPPKRARSPGRVTLRDFWEAT
jgi:hypothetical protein